MKPFTYTPTAVRAAGLASANAKARAAHDVAQNRLVNHEPETYTVTDEQYAHAALDRVADSYYEQALEEAGEAKWDFVLAVAATKGDPTVAALLAELEIAVAEAQAAQA